MDDSQSNRINTDFIAGLNLHYLRSAIEHTELTEGVTLVHRKRIAEVAPQWLIDELKRHWASHSGLHGGWSDHVLVVRSSVPHDGNATPQWDEFLQRKAFRAQVAFWLLKPGRLQTSGSSGPLDMPSSSSLSPMQVDWDKFGSWHSNSTYSFEEVDIPKYREIFGLVTRYGDRLARDTPWHPINVALRAFASASDSDSSSATLLDAFTSMEALIGDKVESTFRLRFRTAHLLADSDDERVELLGLVNRYYAVRSTLVHGSEPLTGAERDRFLELMSNPRPIVDIARRLLIGFLRLVDQVNEFRSMKEFRDRIDGILVHGGHREALRTRMGIRAGAV
jgi:Apea-like HEPN